MRKRYLLGAAALMLMTAGPALAGNASGGGAQKAQLVPRANSNDGDCPQGTLTGSNSAQPNGFVILNSTGKPLSLGSIVGEVSLKNADPGTYMVFLQSTMGGNACQQLQGALTTNAQGNGNYHISGIETSNSDSYWVVLKEMGGAMTEYASGAVLLD